MCEIRQLVSAIPGAFLSERLFPNKLITRSTDDVDGSLLLRGGVPGRVSYTPPRRIKHNLGFID